MKKIFFGIVLILTAMAVNAERRDVTLHIPGMECKNCQAKVEKTLAYEKGVKDLQFDLSTRQVTVTFDDAKTTVEKLQQALVKYNQYQSEVVGKACCGKQNENASGCNEKKCSKTDI